MVKKFDKAIRDKVPEIICAKGQNCKVVTLSEADFLVEIEKKLQEEVEEYKQSKSPEELADIIEVIYRIAELRGIKKEELERLRKEKEVNRGAFSKNLFLIETG
jgi:predicted house-cleaning noncanonical NTP pyrophosphatase (MazG superfamily)